MEIIRRRAREMETKRLDQRRKEQQEKEDFLRRQDERLPRGWTIPGDEDYLPWEEESGEEPGVGPKGMKRGASIERPRRREDIPDWVIEDFGDVDFGEFTLEEVWGDVNDILTVVEEMGWGPLAPEITEQEVVSPEAAVPPDALNIPEEVVVPPEGDETPSPEASEVSDVEGEKGEQDPAQQGETPTPTPTATQEPTPFEYEVKEGDTLEELADDFGVTVEELLEWNEIPNADLITIGQILSIGEPAQGPTATPSPVTTKPERTTQAGQEKAKELLDRWYEDALSEYAGDQRTLALAEKSYYQAQQLIEAGGYSLRDIMGIYVVWTASPVDEAGNYQYTVVDQAADEIWNSAKFGPSACGPAGASSGAIDLGYPISILEGMSIIVDAAGNDYGPRSGIQPSKYYETVREVITNGTFGATGEVYQVQASDGLTGLLMINDYLQEGNVVIVDVLGVSQSDWVGTYLIGESGPVGFPKDEDKSGYFAHFPRVIGFEDDGVTIVLAETFKPEDAADVIKVPVDDFMAAWLDPERRAIMENDEDPENDIELVNNWMLVITPPSKDE